MKKLLPFLILLVALGIDGFADDRLRDVQAELKTQGFYYGEVNGRDSTETSAAVRRYQIRNGLEVTGTLTDETVAALGIGVAPGARQEEPAPAPAPEPTQPPPDLRRDQALENSDKNFLRREETKQPTPEPALEEDPSIVPAPRSLEVPTAALTDLFAETPYASAPSEVQEATLRRAQSFLAGRGLYRGALDGDAGPATEEAILTYQRSVRLPLTGRLDLETLSKMRLMPGRSPIPPKGFVPEQRQSSGQRILRGIWVR